MLRVSAYAVVVDGPGDGLRMLLAHWQAGGRGGWTLPGGGLDPMEDPADAVVREVREETGYDVVVDELLGVDSLAVPGPRRLEPAVEDMHALRILYRAHVVGGTSRTRLTVRPTRPPGCRSLTSTRSTGSASSTSAAVSRACPTRPPRTCPTPAPTARGPRTPVATPQAPDLRRSPVRVNGDKARAQHVGVSLGSSCCHLLR